MYFLPIFKPRKLQSRRTFTRQSCLCYFKFNTSGTSLFPLYLFFQFKKKSPSCRQGCFFSLLNITFIYLLHLFNIAFPLTLILLSFLCIIWFWLKSCSWFLPVRIYILIMYPYPLSLIIFTSFLHSDASISCLAIFTIYCSCRLVFSSPKGLKYARPLQSNTKLR